MDFTLGAPIPWGDANLRPGHFLVKHVKRKELALIGGDALAAPPGSANAKIGLGGPMVLENGAHVTRCGFYEICQLQHN